METKENLLPQTNIKRQTGLQEWQASIAKKINDTLFDVPSASFQNDQSENFMGIPPKETHYEKRQDIESNLIYNFPNIACFLYASFPGECDELVLSLLKIYQEQSGLKFLQINWKTKTTLPEKFTTHAQKKEIDEKYVLYLLGKPFVFKKYISTKKPEEKQEILKIYNKKIKKLFEHPLFRKKLETKIDLLLHLSQTELLRKYINASFDKISQLKTISDREWVEFLVEEAQKEKKQLTNELRGKKRKLKTTTQPADIRELTQEIEKISQDLQKTKDDIGLQDIPKESFSTECTAIIDEKEIEKFQKELAQKRLLHDNLGIDHLEEEIIHSILKHLSRYYIEKSENDKENALLKNFFPNRSLTCFSGAWAVASLLLKIGFPKDNIYIVNSFVGDIDYNHAFLIVRKTDGTYLKVDFGLKEVRAITPTKDMEDLLMFYLNLGYTSAGYSKNNKINGLDATGRIYKLTDGIMVMYLMNLVHHLIEKNELNQALEYLNIVAGIDERNYDLNEARGIIYDKKGEKEKSFHYFKLSSTLISQYYMAKYYFENKQYKKAEGGFDYFISCARNARGIDKNLITSAVGYLTKIKKKQKDGKAQEIGMGIEKQRDFLMELYNYYIERKYEEYEKKIEEYIQMQEVDRKRMLGMLNNYAKGIKHTQPAEIIMDLIKRERLADTKLYKRLNMGKFELNT